MYKPSKIYADLFKDVQLSEIFSDSKTFVDAIPKYDCEKINQDYQVQSAEPNFDLLHFVTDNFQLPHYHEVESPSNNTLESVRSEIENLWQQLSRGNNTRDGKTCSDKKIGTQSSLISLPKPFIVPGGRFKEIYYWDSYFTMLGLIESGKLSMVESMIENFAYLIDHVGHIPNGNRSYYATRSQLPLFALMVELFAEQQQDDAIYTRYLPQLEKEYAFWMAGAESLLNHGDSEKRVIKYQDTFLNRYWDESCAPRDESYLEDIRLANECDRQASDLFRNLRAACESGWDFSSRWLSDYTSLHSINTTQIIPIDLNVVMFKLESVLAKSYQLEDNRSAADRISQQAERRKTLIQELFFSEEQKSFVDLTLNDFSQSPVLSIATSVPLFFKVATDNQAEVVAKTIREKLLKLGGWVTTEQVTGQQWDSPNGWAPMQWFTYQGLRNYGFNDDAVEGALRWVKNNVDTYHATGKFWEKYNVESVGCSGSGGEYSVQEGFGWTNGVLLKFMNELDVGDYN